MQGQRVLGVAVRRPSAGAEHIDLDTEGGGFTFLGLLGMIDPPRPEAVAAIAECQSAGVLVKMITGDHKGTAAAIGSTARASSSSADTKAVSMRQSTWPNGTNGSGYSTLKEPGKKIRLIQALACHHIPLLACAKLCPPFG